MNGKTRSRANGTATPSEAIGPKMLAQLDAEDTAYLHDLIAARDQAVQRLPEVVALQSFVNYQAKRHGVPEGCALNPDGTFVEAGQA